MSGDFSGGFNPNRGNFNNQTMPMNNMGMNNPGQMMGFQQIPDPSGMMGNPVQTGMHGPPQQQQQQQQQLQQMQQQQQSQMGVSNVAAVNNNNNMSLQTPTAPNAPMLDQGQQQQGQQQQQQPQQPQTAPVGGNTTTLQPMSASPFNPITLCKFAQETVQEIVCRFQDIFGTLRSSTPPNGTTQGTEKKVQEQLRTIRLLFKRIRLLYDRCNDRAEISMEYTQAESLIPMKDELDNRPEPPHSEEYKKAVQENRELLDSLTVKNKQLREVIDRLRIMIWEINTMLSMRRS